MTVYYINNQTLASDQQYFDTTWSDNGDLDLSPISANLTVVDSSAYVSKIAPIPDGAGFLMSRLYEDPNVLAIDFRDAENMSAALDRISNFVEVNGKTKVDETLQLSGEGHDLKLEDVADFFNQCLRQKLSITSGEQALLAKLEENGLIRKDENSNYNAASKFVLIGMSRSENIYDRRAIFVHEYSHARYFVNPAFNAAVSDAWSSLAPTEQRFLKGAMMASDWYSSGGTWLLETETQAHAIARPLSEDGFINILISAKRNCSNPDGHTGQCEDFWSYTGDIRKLLDELHDKYMKISGCQIPLLENWGTANELITSTGVPAHCSDKEVEAGQDRARPSPIDFAYIQHLQQMFSPVENGHTGEFFAERIEPQFTQLSRLMYGITRNPDILYAVPVPTAVGRVKSALTKIQETFDARHKRKRTPEK